MESEFLARPDVHNHTLARYFVQPAMAGETFLTLKKIFGRHPV